jgi:hypothetical protein
MGSIAKPKMHLSIVGPRSVAAGQLASYRIMLSRSQPAHRLAYSLKRIQVVGTHAGHRVGHFTLSSLPRGKPRTLRLSVKVPDANDFCITVGARARARARHARPGVRG